MAIKVALAAALLVALVAVASATTYTTTAIDEETNPRSQQCRQQVQGRQFRACQSYLQQRSRSSPYVEEDPEIEANPQRESVEECCEQLREMDRNQCGCEAIKQAVRQAQQGGRSYQTGQSEQMYQKARQLPRMCRLREQQCSFNLVLA